MAGAARGPLHGRAFGPLPLSCCTIRARSRGQRPFIGAGVHGNDARGGGGVCPRRRVQAAWQMRRGSARTRLPWHLGSRLGRSRLGRCRLGRYGLWRCGLRPLRLVRRARGAIHPFDHPARLRLPRERSQGMGDADHRSEHGAPDDDRHAHTPGHAAGPEGWPAGRAGVLMAHDAGWGCRVSTLNALRALVYAQKSTRQRFSARLNRECHRGSQAPRKVGAARAPAGGRQGLHGLAGAWLSGLALGLGWSLALGVGWGLAFLASQPRAGRGAIRSVPRLPASYARGPGPC